jgi:hypothetical protein
MSPASPGSGRRLGADEEALLAQVKDALAAISAAEDARSTREVGRKSRRELEEWARRMSVAAFDALLSNDSYLSRLAPTPNVRPISLEALETAKDVIAARLTTSLSDYGYTGPPPAIQLVLEARRAVERSARTRDERTAQWSRVKSDLSRQREELQHARPSRLRGMLRRTKRTLTVSTLVPALLLAPITTPMQMATEEVVDVGKAAIVQMLSNADESPGLDEQLDALRLREHKAAVREAEAKARQAEAETKRAELELRAAKRASRS